MKKIFLMVLSFFFISVSHGASSEYDINVDDCAPILLNQGERYWCLMNKYHESALILQKTEKEAEAKLARMDKEHSYTLIEHEEPKLIYDSYTHRALEQFPELHIKYILHRQNQCSYAVLRLGEVPGNHLAIARLYCMIDMNLTQIKWIKDSI
ncbi:hypothetical protein [Escherichia fergusonii]|uniref:hypothetical protein n=1 Tax=Escherichia fergusonii TaxID=564 RepID=UPI001CC109A6|nr:hypothetical protein [Escherichia fergusonii]MBZ4073613.1 hypothetical protein [Escherichia fergusonii]MBZ4079392.1 hypothetical protein [Escherichia fergusonii]MBZ4087534.1 hypothetical protein [Escherichia fergusonii]MBZ4089632.1 hypothetical protein [Escherichia fergusonii]MBZ4095199.1 hypothetical protein [Escherichia fergusonii]